MNTGLNSEALTQIQAHNSDEERDNCTMRPESRCQTFMINHYANSTHTVLLSQFLTLQSHTRFFHNSLPWDLRNPCHFSTSPILSLRGKIWSAIWNPNKSRFLRARTCLRARSWFTCRENSKIRKVLDTRYQSTAAVKLCSRLPGTAKYRVHPPIMSLTSAPIALLWFY